MPVEDTTSRPERPFWPAVRTGLRCRCPACGEGKLFRSYLKVANTCPNCGEELHHHRADDAPPYFVIIIVGHLLIGSVLHIEMVYSIAPIIYLMTLIPLTFILSLWMLPIVKGAVVGAQWANYMHGFDPEHVEDHGGYEIEPDRA